MQVFNLVNPGKRFEASVVCKSKLKTIKQLLFGHLFKHEFVFLDADEAWSMELSCLYVYSCNTGGYSV